MILFLHFTDLMSNIDLYSRKLISYLNAVSFRRDSSLLVLFRISISANLANTYLSITKLQKSQYYPYWLNKKTEKSFYFLMIF